MADFELHNTGTVNKLRQEIKELKDGSCRFNCRNQKQVFLAGFDAGMDQGVHWNDKHDAYKAFQQQNGDSVE